LEVSYAKLFLHTNRDITYSDISISVTYDIHRNQLARVIENALCFQGSGKYAEKIHVTLVTPSIFRNAPLKSRLYQYKDELFENLPDSAIAAELKKFWRLHENYQGRAFIA